VKALCVRQPWASLIADGSKTIELRSWRTHYRGPLVIVASTTPASAAARGHPRGVTLAMVDLLDVRVAQASDVHAACVPELRRAGFAWLLGNVRPLVHQPVKGQLGIFEVRTGLVRLAA
jgi:hypothetical protein